MNQKAKKLGLEMEKTNALTQEKSKLIYTPFQPGLKSVEEDNDSKMATESDVESSSSRTETEKSTNFPDAFDISFWNDSSCFSLLPAPEFDNMDSIFDNTDMSDMILLD